jgi:hypothetical protein
MAVCSVAFISSTSLHVDVVATFWCQVLQTLFILDFSPIYLISIWISILYYIINNRKEELQRKKDKVKSFLYFSSWVFFFLLNIFKKKKNQNSKDWQHILNFCWIFFPNHTLFFQFIKFPIVIKFCNFGFLNSNVLYFCSTIKKSFSYLPKVKCTTFIYYLVYINTFGPSTKKKYISWRHYFR